MRLWLIACTLLAACGGTRFTLQVDTPAGMRRSGIHVLLLSPNAVCGFGSLTTDATGSADVAKEYCGAAQLIVGAPGYATARRLLDTCGRTFVRVRLRKAPAPRGPTDECSASAYRFLQIWLARDLDAMSSAFVDPRDAQTYRRDEKEPAPWQVAIDGSRATGSECSVHVSLFYDAGCVEPWRLDMLRVDDTWRVRALTRGEYTR